MRALDADVHDPKVLARERRQQCLAQRLVGLALAQAPTAFATRRTTCTGSCFFKHGPHAVPLARARTFRRTTRACVACHRDSGRSCRGSEASAGRAVCARAPSHSCSATPNRAQLISPLFLHIVNLLRYRRIMSVFRTSSSRGSAAAVTAPRPSDPANRTSLYRFRRGRGGRGAGGPSNGQPVAAAHHRGRPAHVFAPAPATNDHGFVVVDSPASIRSTDTEAAVGAAPAALPTASRSPPPTTRGRPAHVFAPRRRSNAHRWSSSTPKRASDRRIPRPRGRPSVSSLAARAAHIGASSTLLQRAS